MDLLSDQMMTNVITKVLDFPVKPMESNKSFMSVGANDIKLQIKAGTREPELEQVKEALSTLSALLLEEDKKIVKARVLDVCCTRVKFSELYDAVTEVFDDPLGNCKKYPV